MDRLNSNIEQPPVFAQNIEIVESPQVRISLGIRLQILDEPAVRRGQMLQEQSALLLFERFFAPEEREAYFVFRDRKAVSAYQSHRQNIEAATNSVDVRASLDAKGQGQQFRFDGDDRIMRGRRWHVPDFDAHASLQPRFQAIVKIEKL